MAPLIQEVFGSLGLVLSRYLMLSNVLLRVSFASSISLIKMLTLRMTDRGYFSLQSLVICLVYLWRGWSSLILPCSCSY